MRDLFTDHRARELAIKISNNSIIKEVVGILFAYSNNIAVEHHAEIGQLYTDALLLRRQIEDRVLNPDASLLLEYEKLVIELDVRMKAVAVK